MLTELTRWPLKVRQPPDNIGFRSPLSRVGCTTYNEPITTTSGSQWRKQYT